MPHRHLLTRSTWLPRPPAEVFAFFSDAGNLARITPPELSFRILTPLPVDMKVGALIDYRLSLFRVPFGWRTCVTEWDPPHRFVDEEVRGPFATWIHTHEFRAERGGARMEDRVEYALPFEPFSRIVRPLVRRQLERIFDYRGMVIRELLGG